MAMMMRRMQENSKDQGKLVGEMGEMIGGDDKEGNAEYERRGRSRRPKYGVHL